MKKIIKEQEEIAKYYSDLSGKKLEGEPEREFVLCVLYDAYNKSYYDECEKYDSLELTHIQLDLSISESTELFRYLLKKYPKLRKLYKIKLATSKQLKDL